MVQVITVRKPRGKSTNRVRWYGELFDWERCQTRVCSLPISIQSVQWVHHEASKSRGTRHRSENGRKKNKQFEIYADDTTLLAESKEELLQMVTSVKEKSAQAGLYLNLKKNKVMSTEEIEEFEVDGQKVGVVQDFVFLGAKIEDSGSCKAETLRRLALGRAAMTWHWQG